MTDVEFNMFDSFGDSIEIIAETYVEIHFVSEDTMRFSSQSKIDEFYTLLDEAVTDAGFETPGNRSTVNVTAGDELQINVKGMAGPAGVQGPPGRDGVTYVDPQAVAEALARLSANGWEVDNSGE